MNNYEAIDKSNVENMLALSSLQKGILYYYLSKPESNTYKAQLTLKLNGKIDVSLLRKACRIVVRNNEILRTVFRWEGLSNPVQIVYKEYEIPFCVYYLKDYSGSALQIKNLKEEIWFKKIDISRHPVEISFFETDSDRYEMLVTWHHIAYDGWSNAIFISELFTSYRDLLKGSVLKRKRKGQYNEFIRWCRKQDEGRQEVFWRAYFKDFSIKTPFPVDKEKATDRQGAEGGCHNFSLPEDLLKKVRTFIANKGVTLSILVYSAWAILLYKYSGINDITFGITVSGRNADIKGIENMIGLFINTLPLRLNIGEDARIIEIIEKANRQKQSLMPYESTDLTKIRQFSGIDANTALFDTIVVVENYPIQKESWLTRKAVGVDLESYDMREKTEFTLALGVLLPHNNIFSIQYNEELFSEAFVKKIEEHYLHILNEIIEGSDKLASSIELISDAEEEQILLELGSRKSSMEISFDF